MLGERAKNKVERVAEFKKRRQRFQQLKCHSVDVEKKLLEGWEATGRVLKDGRAVLQKMKSHDEILFLPRLYWIAHARRRDLARFDGSRDRASMMFQSCFLAVETKERISAKSIAPCNDRKPPEIFCRSFIMRPSRSA